VNTRYGLLGVLLVNLIAGFAVLLRNRKDTQRGHRFERIGGFRMKHPESDGEVVAQIKYGQSNDDTAKKAFAEKAR